MEQETNSVTTDTVTTQEDSFDIESVLTDTSDFKYTKIDQLDQDPEYPYGGGLQYAVVSNITPEGLLNCKLHGSKIKGAFRTLGEAEKCVEWFRENNPADKYFDIGIQKIGLWTVVDQSLKAEKIKYHDERLDAIMARVGNNQLETLNEMVGLHKENVDGSEVEHRARLKQTIQDAIDSVNKKSEQPVEEVKPAVKTNQDLTKQVPVGRSSEAIKERMRRKREARLQREKV